MLIVKKLIIICCLTLFWFSGCGFCQVNPAVSVQSSITPNSRIVTLAPHLTEWIYALQLEDQLVGVSAYSDYPAAANQKPVIADANGINFKALVRLNPDLILVWEGGNKSQEIARLAYLGFQLFRSSPRQLADIGTEIYQLGQVLNEPDRARQIQQQYTTQLASLRKQYQSSPKLPVFFYLWTKPMMTIGENAWANKALAVCNAQTIFVDSPNDYPEVRMAEVLIRQPRVLITTLSSTAGGLELFWQPHRNILSAPIVQVDGAIINRFTPRITSEITSLCESLRAWR